MQEAIGSSIQFSDDFVRHKDIHAETHEKSQQPGRLREMEQVDDSVRVAGNCERLKDRISITGCAFVQQCVVFNDG